MDFYPTQTQLLEIGAEVSPIRRHFRSNRFLDLADTVLFFPQLLQSLSLSPAMRAIETTIAAIGTKIGLSERLPQLGKFTGEEYVRLTVKSIAART